MQRCWHENLQADDNVGIIFDFSNPHVWIPYETVIREFMNVLEDNKDVAMVGLDKTGLRNRATEVTASLDKFYLCRTEAVIAHNYNVFLSYQLEDIDVQYHLVCDGQWQLRKLANYSVMNARNPTVKIQWHNTPGVWVIQASIDVVDSYTALYSQKLRPMPIVNFINA